jgi:large subunit ribosomal protein LP0
VLPSTEPALTRCLPQVLDLTDDNLGAYIIAGLRNVAAACLALNYPTIASAPHSLINGYKNVLAVAVETDYSFPLAEKVKAYLADPSAFASSDAPAAGSGDAPAAAAAAAPEEEEEEDEDMGFSLFD